MTFNEFMARLPKDTEKHVYLLAGEERYYIDRAQEAIVAQIFKNPEERQEGIQSFPQDGSQEDFIAALEEVPFFSSKNLIVVEDPPFLKDKKSKVENPSKKDSSAEQLVDAFLQIPDFSYLILILSGKADKRKKLYKTIEKIGLVLEAEPVRAWNIGEWLTAKLQSMGKQLDAEAYAYFQEIAGRMEKISLSYFDQEFDKLALFTDKKRISKNDLMKIFASLPEVSSFAMMDAISAKDMGKAIGLLRRQMEDGKYFPLISALLVRHVRQLWQAKVLMAQGIRGKALAGPLELNPFIAEKLSRAASGFSEANLKRAFLALADADYAWKTGQAGDEILEGAILELQG